MHKKAAPLAYLINDFSMGLDWTSPPARVGAKWLVDAENINLTSLKSPEKRKGCAKLYDTAYGTGLITSLYEYGAPNGTNYLLVAGNVTGATGGKIGYYNATTSQWVNLKTSLTLNARYSFAVTNGYCFITNGVDAMFKLKNTTVYSTIGLSAPATAPTVALGAVGYASETKDYSGTSDSYADLRRSTSETYLAQTFKVAKEAIVTSVKLRLEKFSAPSGNTWLEIYTDDNGNPGNIVGTASTVIACSAIATGAAAEYTYTFNNQPQLSIDTTYWLLIKGDFTIDADNFIRTGKSAGDTCSLGYSYHYNGSSWVFVGPDFYFKLTYNVPANVSGRYKWVYAYKTASGLITNYSTATAPYIVRSQTATITCTYSSNAEVTYLVLYRTMDMGEEDSTLYYKVTEVANIVGTGTVGIADSSTDNDLTTQAEINNTAPPLAKYLVVYQDRLIYANCPNETDGHSLFMISKVGSPEAVPSANYHYFDRDDGNAITGITMLPDYLIVFKKNKIAAMTSDFTEWTTISTGIGCIAPWSIITLTDKVIFLSEEGIKCTDGRNVYDIGKKLLAITKAGYWSEAYATSYTGVYYPEKKQFYINLSHSIFTSFVMVGHWLASLYMDITPEFAQEDIYTGWTYHSYPDQNFYTLGTYTDSAGITRVVAGSSTGYVYLLDSGNTDDNSPIAMTIETGWFDLGVPPGLTKTIREISIVYSLVGETAVKLYCDADFIRNTNYVTLSGGGTEYNDYPYNTASWGGFGAMKTENFAMDESTCGKLFAFRIKNNGPTNNVFTLFSIQPFFRVEGLR